MTPASSHHVPQTPNQQLDSLKLGDGRTANQNVVILLLDLFEHAQAATAEQIEVECQALVYGFDQRQSFEKQLARHVDGIAHDVLKSRVERAGLQIRHRIAVPRE